MDRPSNLQPTLDRLGSPSMPRHISLLGDRKAAASSSTVSGGIVHAVTAKLKDMGKAACWAALRARSHSAPTIRLR